MIRKSPWSVGRGYVLGGFAALCWSPDDPPVPPAGNNPPPQRQEPPAPFATFPTQAAFDERLAREARALLKDKYGLSEKDLDARLARAKELEDAEAARLKAQQTTEERLKSEKEAAEALAVKAQAEAAEARRQAEVTSMCARHGFKNVDYAVFEATRSGKTGAELEAHFADMAKDDGKKAALGLVVPAPEMVPIPGNTGPSAPPNGNPPPAPPAPGGNPNPGVDVMKLSPAEFAAHVSRL